jgi:hypothetical protein
MSKQIIKDMRSEEEVGRWIAIHFPPVFALLSQHFTINQGSIYHQSKLLPPTTADSPIAFAFVFLIFLYMIIAFAVVFLFVLVVGMAFAFAHASWLRVCTRPS